MNLLEYQLDDVRMAVRALVREHAFVVYSGGDVKYDLDIAWREGAHERQALRELVDRIVEIAVPPVRDSGYLMDHYRKYKERG